MITGFVEGRRRSVRGTGSLSGWKGAFINIIGSYDNVVAAIIVSRLLEEYRVKPI
jgi:hypothetical protein